MDELETRTKDAVQAAAEAVASAYVPYSGFRMGAAVITDTGTVVKGALVENVSLGLAMCAERVALFAAVTGGAGRPEVLALVAPRTDGALTWPCGACLQVAMEFGGPELLVVASDGTETRTEQLRALAPRVPVKR